MGTHVDTTRPVDMTLDGRARDPRHPADPWGQDPRRTYQRDVWSGNADTDKAWSYEYQFGPVPDPVWC